MFNESGVSAPTLPSSRPPEIIARYLSSTVLEKLVLRPEISNPIAQEAAMEIMVLSPQDTNEISKRLLKVIGTEYGENMEDLTDKRDGALELLKFVDLRKADKLDLLSNYISNLKSLPRGIDVEGAIHSLLEAGKIIAPFLPDRRHTGSILDENWRIIADRYAKKFGDNTDYLRIVGALGEMLSLVPMKETLLLPTEIKPETNQESVIDSPEPAVAEAGPVRPKAQIPPKKEVKVKPEPADRLPRVFQSLEKSAMVFTAEASQFPWLQEDQEINLDHAVLKYNTNDGCYFGDCITQKDLAKTADRMKPHEKDMAYNAFYAILPDFLVRHFAPKLSILDNARTPRGTNIYYVSTTGGQRLYFVNLKAAQENSDKIKEPIIIIVAMCDKAQQIPVLSVLTTSDIKDIKQRGKV